MRRSFAVTVVAVLAGACARSGADDPQTTVPTAPTVTSATTTTVVDPFAVPAVIDAAYVTRVLAALNHLEGDVVRELVETNTVTLTSRVRLRAIYNDPQFEEEVASLVRLLGRGTSQFKQPPGDRRTTVNEVLSASPTCILVQATQDYSEVVVSPPPPRVDQVNIITFRPMQAEADPGGLNPTRWSVDNTEYIRSDEAPPPEATCDGS